MGFWRRLFGGEREKASDHSDPHGIYLHARCDHCGTVVRVRADKKHDLNHDGGGFVWHKTIVDNKCFRRMRAVVNFDRNYQVTNHSLDGGVLVDETAYQLYLTERAGNSADADNVP